MLNRNKNYLPLFILISAVIHFMTLSTQLPDNLFSKLSNPNESVLKIRSIRLVGDKKGKKKNLAFLKNKTKKIIKKPNRKKLSAKDLAPNFNKSVPQKVQNKVSTNNNPKYKDSPRQKPIKALSLSNKNITQYLRGTPNYSSARQYLNSFEKTESLVKLEVPKGIPESELNKHELVFYSFQKRTAQRYINSFHKKLNEFNLKNPHLTFPVTAKKERMVGRVVYDKNGNIVKINMMEWTNTQKLQDFFMEVLQEMTALPNPPKAILKDDEFTVFFALTVNS